MSTPRSSSLQLSFDHPPMGVVHIIARQVEGVIVVDTGSLRVNPVGVVRAHFPRLRPNASTGTSLYLALHF